MAHAIRCEPSSTAELKTVVEDVAVSMSEEDGAQYKRAELCRDNFRGHFENLLKKINVQVLGIH